MKVGKIAFMFPGQGSFEPGMGRDVAEAEPAAMAVFEEGSRASGLDLRRLCFSGTSEELTQTELQQPALVTTSLAINAALRARGIHPDYVVGHSVGEFSALGAAGSMNISETIALVRERGIAMAEAAHARPGSMAMPKAPWPEHPSALRSCRRAMTPTKIWCIGPQPAPSIRTSACSTATTPCHISRASISPVLIMPPALATRPAAAAFSCATQCARGRDSLRPEDFVEHGSPRVSPRSQRMPISSLY